MTDKPPIIDEDEPLIDPEFDEYDEDADEDEELLDGDLADGTVANILDTIWGELL